MVFSYRGRRKRRRIKMLEFILGVIVGGVSMTVWGTIILYLVLEKKEGE
jgi:biotin transporter BioY